MHFLLILRKSDLKHLNRMIFGFLYIFGGFALLASFFRIVDSFLVLPLTQITAQRLSFLSGKEKRKKGTAEMRRKLKNWVWRSLITRYFTLVQSDNNPSNERIFIEDFFFSCVSLFSTKMLNYLF